MFCSNDEKLSPPRTKLHFFVGQVAHSSIIVLVCGDATVGLDPASGTEIRRLLCMSTRHPVAVLQTRRVRHRLLLMSTIRQVASFCLLFGDNGLNKLASTANRTHGEPRETQSLFGGTISSAWLW